MHIARRYSPPPPDPYPLPSLRLVILCVSVAVALSMIVVILLIDVRPPPLSDIFLAPAYFPLGQGLQMKVRRWTKNEKSCGTYGVPKSNYTFGEALCGQALWQSSASYEEGDRYVNKIETIYRFFNSDNLTETYFHWYLENGASLPLTLESYSEETSTAPKAGQELRAYKWDPLTSAKDANVSTVISNPDDVTDDISIEVNPVSEFKISESNVQKTCPHKHCHVNRHIVYVFRQRNVFARLIIFGFNNSKDSRLGVDFAGRLAGIMVDLISQNQPSSLDAFIINFQGWVRYVVRTLPISVLNRAYSGIVLLWHLMLSLLSSESWISVFELMRNQARMLWQHLLYASFSDLYFLLVAVLLLAMHRTQTFLTPYEDMNNVQLRCRSLLNSALEKTRRHTELVKDDVLFHSS